jgi:hypothetical protein
MPNFAEVTLRALCYSYIYIQLKFVCVCSFIVRKRYTDLYHTWHAYSLGPGREYRGMKSPGKVSWFRVPVRTVPVARKLSTIEERRQDQSCLFRRGDYRNRAHYPKHLSWVQVPMKMVSGARKLNTIEERRKEQNCLFWAEVTGTKVTNPKAVLGSSFSEYVGFRDNNFFLLFNDTYRMISPIVSFGK